jgi:tRNA(fMet)-specific endonuclease VapC
MVILDTDHFSHLEWSETSAAMQLEQRLLELPADEVATTIITYEEQMRGWMARLARSKTVEDQVERYRRLNLQLELYCSFKVLDFDQAAAVQFQGLRKANRRLGTMDLKIAAIALAQNAIL